MVSHPVKLVAVSGREQPVVLKIRRDGLWLFTENGKEIQQLPYQHIVKWLPSRLRTKDPGPDDCLDIQVETASGKKDLRMRCQSEAAVDSVIADIRTTVQAIMAELDPEKARQSSPLKAGLAAHGTMPAAQPAPATGGDGAGASQRVSPSPGTGAAAGAQQQQQQQQQQGAAGTQLDGAHSVQPPPTVGAVTRLLDSRDMEVPTGDALRSSRLDSGSRLGSGVAAPALMRRSTGELQGFTGEAEAQIQFLEGMVVRLCNELSQRMGGDPLAALASGSSPLQEELAGLPPWMKESRYLNPLLSAYDHRLMVAQSELAAKTQAVRDIQEQVRQLVAENDSLHDSLARQSAALEARAADTAAAVAATDSSRARLQERLELLEQENDLLVSQQGELDGEIRRLAAALADRDRQVSEAQAAAARTTQHVAQLEGSLAARQKEAANSSKLQEKVTELAERLAAEADRADAATAAQQQAEQRADLLQHELAAASAVARSLSTMQGELSQARASAQAAADDAAQLRQESEGLRSALRAVEGRLVEYQQKDTEVYTRIKEAMELAEEARLERDATRATNDALTQQLHATQARLHEANRQLSGGSVDGNGGPSWAQLRQRVAAAEAVASTATAQAKQQESQLTELRLNADRLARDKASLTAELHALRDELCLSSAATPEGRVAGVAKLSDRLAEVERARDEAAQKLDSHMRATTRAEREWELERQKLQGEVQRLAQKLAAAEEAAAAAGAAAGEAQQAAAAAEAEAGALKSARVRVESELRQELSELRQERDAEVAALVEKLERALATCDKSVLDAEQMLSAKDSLLRRWKQEAQLIANKLEVALQQHQAELAERSAQVVALSEQLNAAHQQQELLQQELDATRLSCQEAELLLGQAACRAAAADAAAAATQDDVMRELRALQGQLERSQLDKAWAERSRDGIVTKMERLRSSAAASGIRAYRAASPAGGGGGGGPCSPHSAGSSAVPSPTRSGVLGAGVLSPGAGSDRPEHKDQR